MTGRPAATAGGAAKECRPGPTRRAWPPGGTTSAVVPGGTVTSRRSTPRSSVQEDSMRDAIQWNAIVVIVSMVRIAAFAEVVPDGDWG
jgi:hypothetical protein